MRLPGEFDLHALEVFVLTVELGGMTQCANRLQVTQSAVSQTIARLEQGLGTALFDRRLRPLGLSPAGRALFERGRCLLAAARTTFDEVRQGAELPIDTVTVGMSESLATQLTAPLLQRHGARANRWKIRSGISINQHAEFLARKFDMLVTGSNMLERIEGLVHHGVVQDPFLLIFPGDYKGPADPAEVDADLPFVRYALDCGMGQRIERQLTRMKLRLPNAIEVDITHQQLTTVALGMGWSVSSLLCLAAQPGLLSQMRVEPLTKGRFSRRIEVVARSDEMGDLPAATARLARDVLRDETFPPLIEALPWAEPLIEWLDPETP
jgi:DNA-binding transcriptional LysR family regulator